MRKNATNRISHWSSIGISLATAASVLLSGCSGGGGGGGATGGSGSGGGTSGGTTVGGTGEPLLVQAGVTSDTCGERLSDVTQVFRLNGTTLDTSIVSFAMTDVGGSLRGGFSESNGDCVRTYQVTMASTGASTYSVGLSSESSCGSVHCKTTWQGTAAPTVEERAAEDGSFTEKVNGERCNPNVPNETGYRPSLFECNGNAAVLFQSYLRNNYSVVVRRNGAFNDRDPNNPTCGTNRCSPYKTQKRMELSEYQVNCLGASGFSDYYTGVNRISVKFGALVTNPQDTSQFEQWCISPTQSLH